MKRIFLLVFVCLLGIGTSAQIIRTFDVKANFRSDFGVGVGMTINLMVPHLDLTPSYNYYFRSGKNAWHIDADLHYNFDVAPLVELYPLGGVSYYYCGKGYAGLNLGAGVTYNFAPEWALKSELKYQFVKHWDDLYVSIGVAYRF